MAGSSSRHHNNNKKEQAMQNKLLLEPGETISKRRAHNGALCRRAFPNPPRPPLPELKMTLRAIITTSHFRSHARTFASEYISSNQDREGKIDAVCARMYRAEHLCVRLSKFTSVCGRKRRESVCVRVCSYVRRRHSPFV